jgi:hypothetical protein
MSFISIRCPNCTATESIKIDVTPDSFDKFKKINQKYNR